ncbi:MAG: hypothetical protein OXC92_06435 [Flavobacteriaceae bacterium]|nr:hypothetical protein [Flavobacteriaceae bacterium]MCY4216602.1 hypothetical protein [Flavobacteriaceae bacterium]MCY4253509.1 hypothetical protein [Flavobacteriaceae bacterium]
MIKPPNEKRPFEELPNYEKILLELHLKVDYVMGEVFKKANIPSNPKTEITNSR